VLPPLFIANYGIEFGQHLVLINLINKLQNRKKNNNKTKSKIKHFVRTIIWRVRAQGESFFFKKIPPLFIEIYFIHIKDWHLQTIAKKKEKKVRNGDGDQVCCGNHNLERKSTRQIISQRGIPPLFRQFISLDFIKIWLQSTFANNCKGRKEEKMQAYCVWLGS
jgi:hypothetical protein